MNAEASIDYINRRDLFSISFYEKSPFYGSFKGMHYRIEKTFDDRREKSLRVITWPGPYNFACTDDEKKESAVFEFSSEGLDKVCDYLNKVYHAKFSGSFPSASQSSR